MGPVGQGCGMAPRREADCILHRQRMFSHQMFDFVAIGSVDIHRAVATISAAAVPGFVLDNPAGAISGFKRGARSPDCLRTLLDLPARYHRQNALDSCDADLLLVDHFAETPDSFEIMLCVETMS